MAGSRGVGEGGVTIVRSTNVSEKTLQEIRASCLHRDEMSDRASAEK